MLRRFHVTDIINHVAAAVMYKIDRREEGGGEFIRTDPGVQKSFSRKSPEVPDAFKV